MGSDSHRARLLRLFLLVTTLGLGVCSAEAQERGDATPPPVDFGARRSSEIFRRILGEESDDYEGIPFDLLELLASMPLPVQLEMLREFGQEMVDQGEANCNIFGGVASCQALSASSAYHASCPNYPLKVDCAFYDDSMVEIDDDPTWDLQDEAKRVGVPMCDGCRDNLEELYCAQAVPKCGTFQTHVELVFLPLLRDVVEAKQKDQDYQPSIDHLLPRVVNATGLVVPCKEFCEAVTASCGCGQDLKFKKVIDMLEKAQREHDDDDLPDLPEGTFEKMFDAFDDTPLCDMYQPRDAPGFVGHCPSASQPLSRDACDWCPGGSNANNVMPTFVEEYLADALVTGVLGWLIGPEGLLADADFFADGDGDYEFEKNHGHPEDWEKRHHRPGDARKGARVGRALGWLIGIASVGAMGYAGFAYYRRRVQGGSFVSGIGDGARHEGYAPVNVFADPEFHDFESPREVPAEPPSASGDTA